MKEEEWKKLGEVYNAFSLGGAYTEHPYAAVIRSLLLAAMWLMHPHPSRLAAEKNIENARRRMVKTCDSM